MAKPKRSSKKKKKDSPLWQWVLVALVAFGLYQVLNHFLPKMTGKETEKPAPAAQKSTLPKSRPETEEISGAPVKKWNLEEAQKYLPKSAYPDNVEPWPLPERTGVLLAYARRLSGIEPGPQGLTNTRPGLRSLRWDGKEYKKEDISFGDLDSALPGISEKNFEGLPHLGKNPFDEGKSIIYPTRLFLKGDDREVMAYLKVSEAGTEWAPLNHPSGKRIPAAFVLGTTAETTRQVRHRKHGGRNYLIVENGILDEARAYEGFQWTVQAYYWDSDHFEYDSEFSKKLTESKKEGS